MKLLSVATCVAVLAATGDANVIGTKAVTVDLAASAASVFVGEPFTLQWTTTDAMACTASGAWSGSQSENGTARITATIPGSLDYELSCVGRFGDRGTGKVTVSAARPAVTLSSRFNSNGATIPSSEGAPYGSTDIFEGSPWLEVDTLYGYGPTKVFQAYICLNAPVAFDRCSSYPVQTGPLSDQMLAAIDRALSRYVGAGVRLLPRFVYNFGRVGTDAPIETILLHIDQLAPILLRYRDLVLGLEAGFIGSWGEWNNSTTGNDAIATHQRLLSKLVTTFGSSFPILARYPADARGLTGDVPIPQLGLHNDYYASNAIDGGTYSEREYGFTPAQLKAYTAEASRSSMLVGEFGALYPVLQECNAIDAYSRQYNLQSLALHVGSEGDAAMRYLDSQGCMRTILHRVGIRLELLNTEILGDSTSLGRLSITATIANRGYGRVIRARPGTLVLSTRNGVLARYPVPLEQLDLRKLTTGMTETYQFSVTLPANIVADTISVALSLPDPAPSLTANAAYALPLNSVDAANAPVFDRTTGYNQLGSFVGGLRP